MKNIILIITDTFRYDNLGKKAERPVNTPHLDQFSKERAISIENFYTGSFPTIPHRTDLAAGVTGWVHYGWQSIVKSSPNHIARLLGEKGYVTQLICDCPHLFKSDFQHPFDAAYQHRGQEGDKPLLHLNDPIEEVMPPEKTRPYPKYRGHPLADQHRWTNRYFRCEEETFAAKTSATAVRWLEENYRSDPFFLWVDFFDPHEPWDPPEYMAHKYDPDYQGIPMIHPNYGYADDYTPKELENLRAHYAAESELVDRYIGRIIEKLDDLMLWEETVVIITADHGHSLGEHNRVGKSNINDRDDRHWPIYPEVGHIPFLIAGGDLPRGNCLDLMAQPVDILPTIGDLCSIELDPPQDFGGASFADQLFTGGGKHRGVAVSGSYHSPAGGLGDNAVTPFLRTERWGYVPVGIKGRPELYDLDKDPRAEENVADQSSGIIKELDQLFCSHLKKEGASDEFIALWKI